MHGGFERQDAQNPEVRDICTRPSYLRPADSVVVYSSDMPGRRALQQDVVMVNVIDREGNTHSLKGSQLAKKVPQPHGPTYLH